MVEQDDRHMGGEAAARELTPEAFDGAFRDVPIWGAKQIASIAGVSPETVRRSWAKDPASPVRRIGGRLVVFAGELQRWLRGAA